MRIATSSRAAPAARTNAKIRSCIFIFYYGGPSHLETYDPKPNAPSEVRGEFKPIATSVPGVQISEHLPRMARLMHKVAIIRSMHHSNKNHDSACCETLTGRTPPNGDVENFTERPQFYPSLGAILSRTQSAHGQALAHAALPFRMRNVITVPCQAGGFLGPAFDPFLISGDPQSQSYRSDLLTPPNDFSPDRLSARRLLLDSLDRTGSLMSPDIVEMRTFYDHAFRLLDSPKIREALDLSREHPRIRDRYGWSPAEPPPGTGVRRRERRWSQPRAAQNLLLARRLVEAGVPFVNVYDFASKARTGTPTSDGSTSTRPPLAAGRSGPRP